MREGWSEDGYWESIVEMNGNELFWKRKGKGERGKERNSR